ncbi:hypothetical protein BDV30DRAFT_232739 [Aspergillus minisclerotigenes]|uniref:Uncharacterized protein n=1 Tax=Aspergillus minisclerotigenes TaxID=656917 RepID=A0A5N6JLR2_9EURO|nr:hypothetical protein BDV30DRAFT_232739 [Aspergillus minisclerotigenes]
MNDDMEDEDDDEEDNTDNNTEGVANLSRPTTLPIEPATEKERNLITNVPTDLFPSFKDHIDGLSSLTLDETIQAISNLIPGLIITVTSNGEYLVTHHNHEGTAGLDRLCEVYDNCAKRWLQEHTSLEKNLLQGSLDTLVLSLYRFGDLVLNVGLASSDTMELPDDCGHQAARVV